MNFEFCATFLNISSNAFMMYKTYYEPTKPVPIPVVCLQMSANLCWIIFSLSKSDMYLFTTANTSIFLQSFTLHFLVKNKISTQIKSSIIKQSTSEEELPRI